MADVLFLVLAVSFIAAVVALVWNWDRLTESQRKVGIAASAGLAIGALVRFIFRRRPPVYPLQPKIGPRRSDEIKERIDELDEDTEELFDIYDDLAPPADDEGLGLDDRPDDGAGADFAAALERVRDKP